MTTPKKLSLEEAEVRREAFCLIKAYENELRSGRISDLVRLDLANFLGSIGKTDAIENSAKWESVQHEEVKLACRVLGLKKNGRPGNSMALASAVAAFHHHRAQGIGTEEDAIAAAHDAYIVATNHPEMIYAVAKERSVTVTKGADVVKSNEAKRRIKNTIEPELRRVGAIKAKQRGPQRKN